MCPLLSLELVPPVQVIATRSKSPTALCLSKAGLDFLLHNVPAYPGGRAEQARVFLPSSLFLKVPTVRFQPSAQSDRWNLVSRLCPTSVSSNKVQYYFICLFKLHILGMCWGGSGE